MAIYCLFHRKDVEKQAQRKLNFCEKIAPEVILAGYIFATALSFVIGLFITLKFPKSIKWAFKAFHIKESSANLLALQITLPIVGSAITFITMLIIVLPSVTCAVCRIRTVIKEENEEEVEVEGEMESSSN